jgi:hypothetical protein
MDEEKHPIQEALWFDGVMYTIPWEEMKPTQSVFIPAMVPFPVFEAAIKLYLGNFDCRLTIARRPERGVLGYRVWKVL